MALLLPLAVDGFRVFVAFVIVMARIDKGPWPDRSGWDKS